MHRLFALCCLALVAAPATAADPPAKYNFAVGRSATYDMTLEIRYPDHHQTWAGSPTYSVTVLEGNNARFNYLSRFEITKHAAGGKTANVGLPGLSAGGGEFVVATHGGFVESPLTSDPLYPLPSLNALPFVPLPQSPADRWTTETKSEIKLVSTPVLVEEYPHGFARPNELLHPTAIIGLPFQEQLHLTESLAFEKKPGTSEFARSHSLVSVEQVNASPRFEFRSTGTVEFADDQFLPALVEWSGTFTLRSGADEIVIPVTASARRLSDRAVAQRGAATEQAQLVAAKQLYRELDQIIADLKSDDYSLSRAAALRLDTKFAGDGNAEIATQIHELYRTSSGDRKRSFGRAIARWATREQPDMLIEVLESEIGTARWVAIERLKSFGTEKAIVAIASRLRDSLDRVYAVTALKEIGTTAEPPVIKMLDDRDDGVRGAAIGILEEIGTEQSLKPLKKATLEQNPVVKQAAEQAILSIETRLSTPATSPQ